ncbi:MAG: hypothetical protein V4628_10075 [Pseudomonadota bacterium]
MLRVLSSILFLTALATLVPTLIAADAGNDFTASVTLSAQCRAKDSGTLTLAFGTYTAFQSTPVTANDIELVFECTRGYVPSNVTFDTTNGTDIGGGVLNGLHYDMDFASPVVTAGNGASSGADDIGSADVRTYAISATMDALQPGELLQPASHTRTLIVSY